MHINLHYTSVFISVHEQKLFSALWVLSCVWVTTLAEYKPVPEPEQKWQKKTAYILCSEAMTALLYNTTLHLKMKALMHLSLTLGPFIIIPISRSIYSSAVTDWADHCTNIQERSNSDPEIIHGSCLASVWPWNPLWVTGWQRL